MSDYLIINGESLEVEKKFDKCVVEGFGSTTEDISINTIIVPVGDTPGPTPTDPFQTAWDLINRIATLTAAQKEESIAAIQENLEGYENFLASADGKNIIFTKDQNFCFVSNTNKSSSAYFGAKNSDSFPIIAFYCTGTSVFVAKINCPDFNATLGDYSYAWVYWKYPSPESLYGTSMSITWYPSNFTVSDTISTFYNIYGPMDSSSMGWAIESYEIE